LKALGEKRDRTPHYLMKEAIEEFLKNEEFIQNEIAITAKRIEIYERTGQSVSDENMRDWARGKRHATQPSQNEN